MNRILFSFLLVTALGRVCAQTAPPVDPGSASFDTNNAPKPGLVEPIDPRQHQGPGRVGIQLDFTKTGYPIVVGLIQGGPAKDAGICYGDIILRIDKNNTSALSQDDVRTALHGDVDQGIDLYIQRNDEPKPRIFVMKRRIISETSVQPLRPIYPGVYYHPSVKDVPLPYY